MRGTSISNSDKVIDSREIIARIEELTDDKTTLVDAIDTARDAYEEAVKAFDEATEESDTTVLEDTCDERKEELDSAKTELEEWETGYDAEELAALVSLADEADGSPDWKYGETLIRDSYFEDYARELAEDCGMVKDQDTWPNRCIDWAQAADELKQDYTQVDFDGETYWIRA